MQRATTVVFTALALLIATRGTSSAQSGDARTRAKAHNERGVEHARAKQYGRAIDEFRAAYRLAPDPVALFNIARAYQELGNVEKAIEYYEHLLAKYPNSAAATRARAELPKLRKQLRDSPPVQSEPKSTATTSKQPETATKQPVTVAKQPAPTPKRGGALRVSGLVSAAAGVILVGVGVKFGLDARAISNELSNHNTMWTDPLLNKHADGKRAARNALIFGGLGTAAVITGGVLYTLGRKAARERRTSISIVPHADSGWLVSASGAF